MKKKYHTPACAVLGMGTTTGILAASPSVNPGDGTSSKPSPDSGGNGWAGSKSNSFGEWDTDTEEE